MSNREIMINALKKTVIKDIKDRGFTGTYPHFKKILPDCVELIDFQTNKYGGSFTIEVSAVFPNGKVTNLTNFTANVDVKNVDVACTNQRYRLKGMFDGWFYYRDVYKLPTGFYHDVSEKEADSFSPPEDWKLLQIFDEKTANDICEEISLQLEDAFEWLFKFEQKNRKKNKGNVNTTYCEEKIINKRIFGFIIAFFVAMIFSLVWFIIDEIGLGIASVFLAIFQILFILITPISYIFSEEKLIIRYIFGLEENIPWQNVRTITSHLEEAGRYYYLESYKFYYYSEEKHPFYMHGVVAKNKKTIYLMDKYCPKKH
jgi:hypothetical protein